MTSTISLCENSWKNFNRRNSPSCSCWFMRESFWRSCWWTRVSAAARSRPLFCRLAESFCIAVATTTSRSSGTSLRSVWIGGGVA